MENKNIIRTFWGWKPWIEGHKMWLWQKLSNMSINTGLNLKTGFVWEKNERIKISEISFSVLYNIFWSLGSDFCATDNFWGIFVDFHFMIFSKFLKKELAQTLIHAREIFFHNTVVNVPRNCWKGTLKLWSSNFQNGTFEKIPQ